MWQMKVPKIKTEVKQTKKRKKNVLAQKLKSPRNEDNGPGVENSLDVAKGSQETPTWGLWGDGLRPPGPPLNPGTWGPVT